MTDIRLRIARGALAAVLTLLATPALAQFDVDGMWGQRRHEDQPERGPGPDVGDYAGLPINDATRMRADSWDASLLTMPEHQCKPHPADYSPRGPANLRIWKEIDRDTQQVMAYRTHISWQAPERTIWMDGRPHPPEFAAHTWQGFSTGSWEGGALKVVTTHLKAAFIRRNGLARSDLATMTEYWYRRGNVLTHLLMLQDPVYLTEPFVRTTNWELEPDLELEPYPCGYVVEVVRARGEVPHHLPGTNPFLEEYATRHNLPLEGVRGGAETALPEFMRRIEGQAARPGAAGQQ